MRLQALIFDVDGTLADTERDGHRPAFNAAFAAADLAWQWDETLYGELLSVTGGKERIRHYAEHFDPAFLADPDCDSRIRQLHAAKTEHYLARLASGAIPLRPGVARLLREARQAGLRLAIATTTTAENVTELLRTALGEESLNWFEVLGAGDLVANKKPSPDIYTWVMERLQLQPGECLAVEDSANGLAASLGAGIPTLITINDYTRGQDFTGAISVVSDLGEPDTAADPGSQIAGGRGCVDVELLREWHAQAVSNLCMQ
jgi:beta-phosphoglucomutase-like phosphatase (HAD superfamily)